MVKNMIDHILTSEVVCPYCGHVHSDSWELPDYDDSFECYECGKKFYYGREVEVTYSSHKLKPDGKPDYYDEIPDEEKQDGNDETDNS